MILVETAICIIDTHWQQQGLAEVLRSAVAVSVRHAHNACFSKYCVHLPIISLPMSWPRVWPELLIHQDAEDNFDVSTWVAVEVHFILHGFQGPCDVAWLALSSNDTIFFYKCCKNYV